MANLEYENYKTWTDLFKPRKKKEEVAPVVPPSRNIPRYKMEASGIPTAQRPIGELLEQGSRDYENKLRIARREEPLPGVMDSTKPSVAPIAEPAGAPMVASAIPATPIGGDRPRGATINAGPSKGELSDAQWEGLSNEERIARNVAAFDAQTAAVRDLRNARRAAEGSAPVGGRTPSAGIGAEATGFSRMPTRQQGFDYSDFRNIRNPEDRRAAMQIASELQQEQMSEAGAMARAQMQQESQLAKAAAKQAQPIGPDFGDLINAQKYNLDERRFAADQQQQAYERQINESTNRVERENLMNDQLQTLTQSDPDAVQFEPILRDFMIAYGKSPLQTFTGLRGYIAAQSDNPDLTATLETIREGEPEEKATALNALAAKYAEYLSATGGM